MDQELCLRCGGHAALRDPLQSAHLRYCLFGKQRGVLKAKNIKNFTPASSAIYVYR